jgi:AcrR family transcriptional regulator
MATREAQRLETRQRIYEQALVVFRRDGVAECRIDDIASGAGVSRGAFYFHFPTKEHVLLARMRETEDIICAAIDALPEDAKIADVISALTGQLASIWQGDPDLLPDVCGAALRYTATTMRDQEAAPLRSMLSARFKLGVARGEIASHLPPEMLSDLFLGHMLAGLLAWFGGREMPLRSMLEAVAHIFWKGAESRG